MSSQSPQASLSPAALLLAEKTSTTQAATPAAADKTTSPVLRSPEAATNYSTKTGIPIDIGSLETACTPDAQTPQFLACGSSPQAAFCEPPMQRPANTSPYNPTLRCLRVDSDSREQKSIVSRHQPTEEGTRSTSFRSPSKKQCETWAGTDTRGETPLAGQDGLDVNRKRRVSQPHDSQRRMERVHNGETRAFPKGTNTGTQKRHASPVFTTKYRQETVSGSDRKGGPASLGINAPHIKVRSFVPFQFHSPRRLGSHCEQKCSCAENKKETSSRGYPFESQRWDNTRILPLKALIGSGAMGHVYLVEIEGQQYALKLAVQSDPAACMYLRHGWRNLIRLETMYLAEEAAAALPTGVAREKPVEHETSIKGEVDADMSDPTRSCPFCCDGSATPSCSTSGQTESKKGANSTRYFCKPLAFLEGDWIRFQGERDTGCSQLASSRDARISGRSTTPNSRASPTPRVTPICAYIMEYIPNACQLTAFIWNFHRTSDLSQLLRSGAYPQGILAAKRLVDLSIRVATAHKVIACKAGMISFDFNPKNILVNVELPAYMSDRLGATGQPPVLSAAEITRMVLCNPSAKFRVVAIDLDCSLRAPFSSVNEDSLLLDWSCGRRVVYSCPHVSSITAAYILAVLAKNKGEGQFARSGLKESVAHGAICRRVDDKRNFLHYMWSEKNVVATNNLPCTGVANRTAAENCKGGGRGDTPALPFKPAHEKEDKPLSAREGRVHSEEEPPPQHHTNESFFSRFYLPCFIYPRDRLPRDVSQKEYKKYGVRLVGNHVNLQLLAFILCELLDFKSLHVVVLQKFTTELRLLQLPTDICRMFSEQDQIISCLCFSVLTKMKSATIETSGLQAGDCRVIKAVALPDQLNNNVSSQPNNRAPTRCMNHVRNPIAEDTLPALSHAVTHSTRTANSATCFSPAVVRPKNRRFLRTAGAHPLIINKTGHGISQPFVSADRTSFAFFRKEQIVASSPTPPGHSKKDATPGTGLNFRGTSAPDSFVVTAGLQRIQSVHQNAEPPPSMSSEESVVAGNSGRQAVTETYEDDGKFKENARPLRNSSMAHERPGGAEELRRPLFTAEEVSKMSVWEKVEALPALSPQDFLPSVDIFGRRCREEMSSLNSLLLEFLDPHPFYVLRNYKSPEHAFDSLVQSLHRLSQRISS
ncbi:conserved hypothetical protein [Neospora caninum Liverpool]|uniref:Protein kinase domain-containing protein n=1 Tax=Neospora caninum (strain Liverpool) TaxID=572307 RepID=F0V7U3_NEOCL|nr:conserved hypothetical protein [Neospora caninum Liverpool]CBZ49784.1 conserved hypothetical protein [Neospora caninum Liverpool]CEL64372.1 TPA: hypothetical protein BN1204_002720 [Neospora caninum Liverpool]|eukprot:XP_003879819.1 conserved hypothetical protein [Neospora caninum Liverpool]